MKLHELREVLNSDHISAIRRVGEDRWYLSLHAPGHLAVRPYSDPIEEGRPHPVYRRFLGTLDQILRQAHDFLDEAKTCITAEACEAALQAAPPPVHLPA